MTRPWHERTPVVLGASVGAVLVIALLYFVGSYVSRSYDEPPPPPAQYIEPPSTTSTAAKTTTATTTITSVAPPETSEIDNPTADTSGSSTSPTTSTKITQSRQNRLDPRSSPHVTVYPRPVLPQ